MTVAIIGLFLVSVNFWGVRGDHKKYEVPSKVPVQVLELQPFPTRPSASNVVISVSSDSFAGNNLYSPQCLMEDGRTIWHAEHPPKYPQWVEISFSEPTIVSHLGIRTQGDSYGGEEHCRGPKDFLFQATRDPHVNLLKKRKWDDLLSVTNNEYSQGEEWKDWFFENHTAYRYYRIYIQAGGDPDYLTIRQVRLDNVVEAPSFVEKTHQLPAQVVSTRESLAVTDIPASPTFHDAATQRVVLNPPLKIDPMRVRERYDKLQEKVGVKTKEEAMEFSLAFWEKKRKAYSL